MSVLANWQLAIKEIKDLVEQLNQYVLAHDWLNAHLIANKIQFKVKYASMYEEERVKNLLNEKTLHSPR